MLAQGAERRRAIEARAFQPRIGLAAQEVHRGLQPEAAVHARDRAQGLAHDEGHRLARGGLLEGRAHVALSASVQRLRLVAEVAQDRVVPAAAAFRPAHQLQEEAPLVGEDGLAGRVHLQEAAPPRHVGGRDDEQAPGGRPVAPGPSDFLVVGLDRSGRTQVHDGAHVSAIDAHAERVGRDHHLDLPVEEGALGLLACVGPQAGVIDGGLPPALREARRLLFRTPPRRRVRDRDPLSSARPAERFHEERIDLRQAPARVVDFGRTQSEVRAREATNVLRRVRGQAEPAEDLVADDGGRGRGAGQHARGRHLGQQPPDLEVLRAEVVPPFADAVRLVDRDQRDLDVVHEPAEAGVAQPLRGDVYERVGPPPHRRHAPADLVAVQGRGQERGAHSAGGEGLNLVVHQGHERRDDERRPRQRHRR